MGCDTILRLKGHITAEQIVDYINEHYKLISDGTHEKNYNSVNQLDNVKEQYDDSNEWKITSGFISFNDGDKNRAMFYLYQNVNFYENLKYYREHNLEDMVKSETTHLSLGSYGNSVEIMKGIAKDFGGWLDEDDCDDEPPYWIDKIDNTRYCWSYDGECYTGSFNSEIEAIEDAKECVGDICEEVYIGTCEKPTLSWNSNEEEIIQSIYDNLYEECGEVSESFEITREQELELANRIDKCVKQWIKDMRIKPNCWAIVNEHLVKLR